MTKPTCKDCMRFDRTHDQHRGYCTQLGEDTSTECSACWWYAPRYKDDEEEKDKS